MSQTQGESEHQLHKQHPEILRGYAELLSDVSSLVEVINESEDSTLESRSDAFTFAILNDDDVAIPERIWDQIGRISHFTIAFERGMKEPLTGSHFASMSIELFAGDTVYHTSRDNLGSHENPEDTIYSRKNPENATLVPQLSTAEFNALVLSVLFRDSPRDDLFAHSTADLNIVNANTLAEIQTALLAHGIHDRDAITYDFDTSDSSIVFAQELGKPSHFHFTYVDFEDKNMSITYSMNKELSILFEVRDDALLGAPFEGTIPTSSPLQPTIEDIDYANSLIRRELRKLHDSSEPKVTTDMIEVGYTQVQPEIERFSTSATQAILNMLDFDSPASSEFTDE